MYYTRIAVQYLKLICMITRVITCANTSRVITKARRVVCVRFDGTFPRDVRGHKCGIHVGSRESSPAGGKVQAGGLLVVTACNLVGRVLSGSRLYGDHRRKRIEGGINRA